MRNLVALLALGLVLAACGGTALKASTNPQVRQAQNIVSACLSKHSILTKSGRQAFLLCVAPKGDQKKVESCIQTALAHGRYFTKGERTATEEKVITCVVKR